MNTLRTNPNKLPPLFLLFFSIAALCACGAPATPVSDTIASTELISDSSDTIPNTELISDSSDTTPGADFISDSSDATPGADLISDAAERPTDRDNAPSSRDFALLLGQGINLGNTMEACDNTDFTTTYPIRHYETLWGQPVTTQEMIDAMRDAGFTTLRIPVAWTNTMDFLHGDYTIREEQLARVREIVDYAYRDGMYVILNDHWDNGWWGMFGSADPARRAAARELYTRMWEQIAAYFADYDEHLIFEGGNEELGSRFNDTDPRIVPDGGTLSEDACYATANEINQLFVDTVRAGGGRNAGRFLLIPGYDTDITRTLDPRWQLPTDSAPDRLLLSVHYYTPWGFCGGGEEHWGSAEERAEMERLLESLLTYGERCGVIIGEYGVLPGADQRLKSDALLWYTSFRESCERFGYASCLWDTGNLLDKTTHQWIDEELGIFFKRG